jgi:hypothetical protein
MRRILSAEQLYVNKIPINFIGIKRIPLFFWLLSLYGNFRFGTDPAAPHGASVEQEGR